MTKYLDDIFYWLGMAYEKAGRQDLADRYYQAAAKGKITLGNAMYYNDQQPDKIFYQGLAWRRLGRNDLAAQLFNRLLSHGKQHEGDEVSIDYFAVSLPNLLIFEDDLSFRNRVGCIYLQGLGYLGLEQPALAESCFREVLKFDITHAGAHVHLNLTGASRLL